MGDILGSLFALLATGAMTGLVQRGLPGAQRQLIWIGFVMHAVAAFAQLWLILTVYGGVGDTLSFFREGDLLARWLERDLIGRFPDLLSLLFHGYPRLPFLIQGIGQSTGAMSGLGSILLLLLDSRWAGNLLIGQLAFLGQVQIFLSLRRLTPPQVHLRLGLAILLLPSVVFWSAGLTKEGVALIGLGALFQGISRFFEGERRMGAVFLALGVLIIGLFKAYILFPWVIALGVWIYWRRAVSGGRTVQIRPARLILAAAIGWAGIVLLGELFPKFAIDNLGEQMAQQQVYGRAVQGGSSYSVGDPTQRGLLGQLAFAPLGLVASLFRPFLFEARSLVQLVNALETALLMFLLGAGLYRHGWRGFIGRIFRSPLLMFCLTFVLLFGTAVGISTTNLGTLSRYRLPMMPFYALLLLLLDFRDAPAPSPIRSRALGPAEAG
ncbi:MAG: hypothetical protein OEY14_17130 [Myxococcales bacterium]|nr:hypothetical protein [Myxococcales bacterium]